MRLYYCESLLSCVSLQRFDDAIYTLLFIYQEIYTIMFIIKHYLTVRADYTLLYKIFD